MNLAEFILPSIKLKRIAPRAVTALWSRYRLPDTNHSEHKAHKPGHSEHKVGDSVHKPGTPYMSRDTPNIRPVTPYIAAI